jgi:ADP-heptose:LPS heptosyltransferase
MRVDIEKSLFDWTSRLTERHPWAGARLLNPAVYGILAHPILGLQASIRNRRIVSRAGRIRRVLVVPDIHIGDAVFTQAAVRALREALPEAEIDFAVNRSALPLLRGNPDVTRFWGIFNGGTLPSRTDIGALRLLLSVRAYDLVFNFCPFLDTKVLDPVQRKGIDFMGYSHRILADERRRDTVNHFMYQQYRFIQELLVPVPAGELRGVRVFLADDAVDHAWMFLDSKQLLHRGPFLFLNPDTASPYTRIPDFFLSLLLRRLAGLSAHVLLGEGHSDRTVAERILEDLPTEMRGNITLVPRSLPIDAYAALADLSAVFLSGDTGPLHLAAAWKVSPGGGRHLRNQTCVIGIFGATPARMSGYASGQPGFLPSCQDAPSFIHVSDSPCRNITCLNKMFKTCRVPRCFASLDLDAILEDVRTGLSAVCE